MVLELKVPHGCRLGGAASALAGLLDLRAQLRVPGHLLEQPPPHAARHRAHQRQRSSGPTCTCSSGCRWSRSRPDGWARTTSRRCRPRSTACVLLASAIAYKLLQDQIVALEGPESKLARAVGRDAKGLVSPVLYALAIPLAFVQRWVSLGDLRVRRADVAGPRSAHRIPPRVTRRRTRPLQVREPVKARLVARSLVAAASPARARRGRARATASPPEASSRPRPCGPCWRRRTSPSADSRWRRR